MVQSYRRMPSEFRQDVDGNEKDLTNLGSVGAERLNLNETGSRTGFVGDSGELQPIGTFTFDPLNDLTTTSTSYVELTGGNTRSRVPVESIDLSGVSALKIAWTATLQNDTGGEDTTVKLELHQGNFDQGDTSTTTEVTHSGTGFTVYTSPTAYVDPADNLNVRIEGKVTGGTGRFRKGSAVLYGEIE